MKETIIILLLLLISSSCKDMQERRDDNYKRSITILTGCDDIEVINDLKYSVEKNINYLIQNKIEIIVDEDQKECGYILKNNNKIKHIKSVLTDVELIDEFKTFFNN